MNIILEVLQQWWGEHKTWVLGQRSATEIQIILRYHLSSTEVKSYKINLNIEGVKEQPSIAAGIIIDASRQFLLEVKK